MSRLTGSDAKNLMEAYASVYAPQELTEEQIWEEVENWVNSLLEEGYDLSDYTWEEMYENYIEEVVGDVRALRAKAEQEARQKQLNQSQKEFKAGGGEAALNAARGRRENLSRDEVIKRGQLALKGPKPDNSKPDNSKPDNTAGNQPSLKAKQDFAKSKGKYYSSSDGKTYANYNDALAARKSRLGSTGGTGGGGSGTGGGGSGTGGGGTADLNKLRPSQPTASPKPPAPAIGKLGNTSFERRTPTSAELKAAQAARASGASPEKALQAAKAAGTTAKIQSAGQEAGAKAFKAPEVKQTAALAATPKPTPVAPRQTAREKMLNQSYEYDAFDLVLEYLIDNGHVETVDEALYVMMEMDAEVIRDIVEEVINEGANYDKNRRRAAQRAAARNAARDAGQTGAVPGVGYVTPRRESETYRDSAGVERHKTGARMPKKD